MSDLIKHSHDPKTQFCILESFIDSLIRIKHNKDPLETWAFCKTAEIIKMMQQNENYFAQFDIWLNAIGSDNVKLVEKHGTNNQMQISEKQRNRFAELIISSLTDVRLEYITKGFQQSAKARDKATAVAVLGSLFCTNEELFFKDVLIWLHENVNNWHLIENDEVINELAKAREISDGLTIRANKMVSFAVLAALNLKQPGIKPELVEALTKP